MCCCYVYIRTRVRVCLQGFVYKVKNDRLCLSRAGSRINPGFEWVVVGARWMSSEVVIFCLKVHTYTTLAQPWKLEDLERSEAVGGTGEETDKEGKAEVGLENTKGMVEEAASLTATTHLR
jgi:hypothetical protein